MFQSDIHQIDRLCTFQPSQAMEDKIIKFYVGMIQLARYTISYFSSSSLCKIP
jgi:hypothetical protein